MKETIIENKLIDDLKLLGWEYEDSIKDEASLIENFRTKLNEVNKKKLNGKNLTDSEFERFYYENIKRLEYEAFPVFEAADRLRQPSLQLTRDDGTIVYLSLFSNEMSENTYQVAHQIKVPSGHRYDVTLLVNGLPLVQIELKTTSIEVSKAKNQVNEYRKLSYSGLFYYIQLFVCSNGNDTVYGANKELRKGGVDFYYWTNEKNSIKPYLHLADFTNHFLQPFFVTKYINNYMVLMYEDYRLLALRPYQVYAIQKIVECEKNKQNGYVWHTTGSGKTITSWKIAQVFSSNLNIYKTLLVVDSVDLDEQMRQEYRKLDPFCDVGEKKTNTRNLVKALTSPYQRLIVVTVQTLTQALKGEKFAEELKKIKDKRVVFIVDEAHRSWYSIQKNIIKNFFTNANYYGFTGTPLMRGKNISNDEPSTEEVFGKCVHFYTLQDAIRDVNVLGFDIDYIKSGISKKDLERLTKKELSEIDKDNIYHNPKRISLVSNNIIHSFKQKTLNGSCSALFATDSIKAALLYYKEIRKQAPELKTAVIFSADIDLGKPLTKEYTDEFEAAMKDYNKIYGTKYDLSTQEAYRTDISLRLKHKMTNNLDLLIVVDMFLTGFDSPYIACIYVDKNLKYHRLIQAFSRGNRLYPGKERANIVIFRDLQKDVDEALTMFSSAEGIDEEVARTYSDYINYYVKAVKDLKNICNNPEDSFDLVTEQEIKDFLSAFKEVTTSLGRLQTFEQFKWEDINSALNEEDYNSYVGFYKKLSEEVRNGSKKVINIDEFDFEIVKEKTVIVNLAYIINLLHSVKTKSELSELKLLIEKTDNEELNPVKRIVLNAIDIVESNTAEPYKDMDVKIIEQFAKEKNKEIIKFAEEHQIDPSILFDVCAEASYGKPKKAFDIIEMLPDDCKNASSLGIEIRDFSVKMSANI